MKEHPSLGHQSSITTSRADELRRTIPAACEEIRCMNAECHTIRRHQQGLRDQVLVWREELDELEESDGGSAEAAVWELGN